MLTKKDFDKIREELDNCKNPLFFFHDDPDGLTSFLLFYRYVGAGHGIVIKTNPKIDFQYVKKVEEYKPDKVFILDIAMVDQDFLNAVNIPVIWVDHHEPLKRDKVLYFNPRINKKTDNIPASTLCYYVVNQDLWLAMIGAIGDWYFPPFAGDFLEKHPGLMDPDIKDPDKALFGSKVGTLVFIFSFILKGRTSDVMRSVKTLTRIDDPNEILDQTTAKGKYIYKRYLQVGKVYEKLLKRAIAEKGKMIVFTYMEDNVSFTKDLANQVLYNNPDSVVIIGREKGEEVKMSIRSKHHFLPAIVEKAMSDVEGYGGGHEHACGACVKIKDFPKFVANIKREVKL
ncbi:MAG: DHHA1 domain-containing protein [Nanoarchaeota archaeon]|nr:DHHA1 domain-containing protein [Nanoarchaeota archaeon]